MARILSVMKSCPKLLVYLLLFFVVLLSLTQTSAAEQRVVTTFTIIADMARNVAGDRIKVDSITKAGAEIHDYEPTPLDIVKVRSADFVLWNGFGLERWFERFFSNLSGVPAAVLTEGIEPISIVEGPYSGKPNPHSWMSPRNALIYVRNIEKALTKLDPANAAIYSRNAAEYSGKLSVIDRQLANTLAEIPPQQRWLVSSEGAFSYLIRDYQMKELFLWPVNADQEGTPQQVRRVIDFVRSQKIPVVFSESTISDKAMRQVAKESGAHFGGLLYVDSLTSEDQPAPTYLKMLEINAETILQGFKASKALITQ